MPLTYQEYSEFIATPYKIGVDDCYGLVRKVYRKCYGIEMPNYARPKHFEHSNLNLVNLILNHPDFIQKGMNPNFLNQGDVLFFRCASDSTNHFGIYVGNNLFIHHAIDATVREENLDHRWLRRLTNVAYHKDIVQERKTVLLTDFLPEHFRSSQNAE